MLPCGQLKKARKKDETSSRIVRKAFGPIHCIFVLLPHPRHAGDQRDAQKFPVCSVLCRCRCCFSRPILCKNSLCICHARTNRKASSFLGRSTCTISCVRLAPVRIHAAQGNCGGYIESPQPWRLHPQPQLSASHRRVLDVLDLAQGKISAHKWPY